MFGPNIGLFPGTFRSEDSLQEELSFTRKLLKEAEEVTKQLEESRKHRQNAINILKEMGEVLKRGQERDARVRAMMEEMKRNQVVSDANVSPAKDVDVHSETQEPQTLVPVQREKSASPGFSLLVGTESFKINPLIRTDVPLASLWEPELTTVTAGIMAEPYQIQVFKNVLLREVQRKNNAGMYIRLKGHFVDVDNMSLTFVQRNGAAGRALGVYASLYPETTFTELKKMLVEELRISVAVPETRKYTDLTCSCLRSTFTCPFCRTTFQQVVRSVNCKPHGSVGEMIVVRCPGCGF